jgi:hypothetical protein
MAKNVILLRLSHCPVPKRRPGGKGVLSLSRPGGMACNATPETARAAHPFHPARLRAVSLTAVLKEGRARRAISHTSAVITTEITCHADLRVPVEALRSKPNCRHAKTTQRTTAVLK